jgi:PhnB protein
MGADAPTEVGNYLNKGNNIYINLGAESKEEAEYYFNALSAGGKVEMDLQMTFWGALFGSFIDKFGINWMVIFEQK